jgi:hypothetical protein
MYLMHHAYIYCERKMTDLNLPDGTDCATVDYGLGYLECLFNLLLRSCGDGLFDEQCSLGEVLQDLELDIAARARGAAEHGGRANNNSARTFAGRRVLDKLLESLEDASVFIGGTHESFAFLGEDCGGTIDRGVDERDNLETRAEFTEGVGGCECIKGVNAEKTHCSKRKEWFQGPSSEPMG